MIVLKREDLRDQAGMERALKDYFRQAETEFAGQLNTMLGPEFYACDYEKKTVVLVMEPKPWMGNPIGILHGGITASLLDMTMGLLCRFCSGGYMTPTVGMNVQYLRSGPLDKRIFIRADVTKTGLSICCATGGMWAEGDEDRLIATASGTYYVTQPARKN